MNAILQECPSAAQLAAWLDGNLSNQERQLLLDHALGCATCSDLLADVLTAQNDESEVEAAPRPIREWRTWAVAAALLLSALGGCTWWLRAPAGEASYRRALVSALPLPGQSEAALWLHPPATVSTADLPVARVFRGTSQPSCAPETPCGEALAEARQAAGSPLRLRLSPRAVRTYLAASALDPETAYQAVPVIDQHDWLHAEDPSVRIAAWLVRFRANLATPEEAGAAVAELDPAKIDDPPTLYNLARLAQLVGATDRACAAWRAFLARETSGPWADAAAQQSAPCDRR